MLTAVENPEFEVAFIMMVAVTFKYWGGEGVDLGIRLFLKNNCFIANRQICSVHCLHEKHISGCKQGLENAGKKIHQKYNFWQTSLYGCDPAESQLFPEYTQNNWSCSKAASV